MRKEKGGEVRWIMFLCHWITTRTAHCSLKKGVYEVQYEYEYSTKCTSMSYSYLLYRGLFEMLYRVISHFHSSNVFCISSFTRGSALCV